VRIAGASLIKSIESSEFGSGSVLVIVVFYTLALFKMPSLHVVRVIEHFAPRLIQDTFRYRLLILSHRPYNPNDAGNSNQYNYNFRYGESGCVCIHGNLPPSNGEDL